MTYFFNTAFSFRPTVCNIHSKLNGYVKNILFEGSLSQNVDLCSGFLFMI